MGGSWKRGRCSGEAQGDVVNVLRLENLQLAVRVRRGGGVLKITHTIKFFLEVLLKVLVTFSCRVKFLVTCNSKHEPVPFFPFHLPLRQQDRKSGLKKKTNNNKKKTSPGDLSSVERTLAFPPKRIPP